MIDRALTDLKATRRLRLRRWEKGAGGGECQRGCWHLRRAYVPLFARFVSRHVHARCYANANRECRLAGCSLRELHSYFVFPSRRTRSPTDEISMKDPSLPKVLLFSSTTRRVAFLVSLGLRLRLSFLFSFRLKSSRSLEMKWILFRTDLFL